MKLSKALKLKNRLAGEIARLKQLVQSKNVSLADAEKEYDVQELMTQLRNRVDQLVAVKTVIAAANAGVSVVKPEDLPYYKIFRVAEIKGLLEMLKSLNTMHGVAAPNEYGVGMGAAVQHTYIAQLRAREVDILVTKLQKLIDDDQESLDALNATKDVKGIDDISV
jgi:hypothetical protein